LPPQFLRAADVARLAALVAAANQDDDFPSVQSVINAESRTETDPQFKHAATNGLAIAEIPGAHAGQSRIHRRLHPHVAQGIKPFIKRDESVLKLQLLDFPLNHFECNL
jgi:hypothetical protein